MNTPFDHQIEAWQSLKETHTYHARFGRTLLATAYALLESIPIIDKRVVIDEKTIDLLEKFARQGIKDAVKIEADARAALVELEKNKPEMI